MEQKFGPEARNAEVSQTKPKWTFRPNINPINPTTPPISSGQPFIPQQKPMEDGGNAGMSQQVPQTQSKWGFLTTHPNIIPINPTTSQIPPRQPVIPEQKPMGDGGKAGMSQLQAAQGNPIAAPNMPSGSAFPGPAPTDVFRPQIGKVGPQIQSQVQVKVAPFSTKLTTPVLGGGKPKQELESQAGNPSVGKPGSGVSNSSSEWKPSFQKPGNAPIESKRGYPSTQQGLVPPVLRNTPTFGPPSRLSDPQNVSGRQESGSSSSGIVQEDVPTVNKPSAKAAESFTGERVAAGTGNKSSPMPFLVPQLQKVGPTVNSQATGPGIQQSPMPFLLPPPQKVGPTINFPQGLNPKKPPFTPFQQSDQPQPLGPVPSYVKIDPGKSQPGSMKLPSISDGGVNPVFNPSKPSGNVAGRGSESFKPYADPLVEQAYSNQEYPPPEEEEHKNTDLGMTSDTSGAKLIFPGTGTGKETKALNMLETSYIYQKAEQGQKERSQFQPPFDAIEKTSTRGSLHPHGGQDEPKPQFRPQSEERKLPCKHEPHNAEVPEKFIYTRFYCPQKCSICISCVQKEVAAGARKCPICQRLYGRVEMRFLKS